MFDKNKLNQYIITMSSNPFISKEVDSERIYKGLKIGLPVVIMIFVLGVHYINLIDDSLKEKYQTEKIVYVENKDVLGVQAEYQERWKEKFEELNSNYEIDDYVWEWDGQLEGSYQEYPYISIPKYYLSGDKAKINETWILEDGYKLELNCPEKDLSTVIAGEYYSCTVKYNGEIVSDIVRWYISYPKGEKTVGTYVDFIVYSSDYQDYQSEYILIGTYHGGSFDDISVFSLESGKAKNLPFYFKGEFKDTWLVSSPLYVDFYYNSEEVKLVTKYHEPSMAVKSVNRVWNMGEDSLTLERTFGNIVDYDK